MRILAMGDGGKEISCWEASGLMLDSNPVFIVGTPRSGTSLLYKLILRHPSFSCKDNTPVESKAFDLQSLCTRSNAARFMQNAQLFQKFTSANALPLSIHRWAFRILRFLTRVSPELYMLAWKATLGPVLVRNFFFYARQGRGCQRLVEKTPDNVFRIQEVFESFPRARVICIYRHPMEVFSSYRKRLAKDRDSGRPEDELNWLKVDTETFCKRYKQMALQSLDLSEREPERFLMVRYEELVREPASVLRRLMAFLQEPYPAFYDELVCESFGDSVEFQPATTVAAKTKEWRDWLTPEDAQEIQRLLSSLMSRLQYEMSSSPEA